MYHSEILLVLPTAGGKASSVVQSRTCRIATAQLAFLHVMRTGLTAQSSSVSQQAIELCFHTEYLSVAESLIVRLVTKIYCLLR